MTLIEAIKRGHREQITKALAEIPDINARDEINYTALMHACQKRDIETIKLLLQYPEIEIDLSVDQEIALMLAAPISGDPEEVPEEERAIVTFFLNKLETHDHNIETKNYILHYSAWIGNAENIQRCLQLGANPNACYLKTPPLSRAVESGSLAAVESLLAAPGININQADYRRDVPIINAICYQQLEIAYKLLEDPRCELTHSSFLFGTPLLAAIHFGYHELARAILEQWQRCDLPKELPSFLLTIQKGQAWDWLFYKFLEKGINVNMSCEAIYKWLFLRPQWIIQECDAAEAPFGERQFLPTIGDGTFILDRPIWVALHCNNRNAIKCLLEFGARLDAPSESFLRIDNWYTMLPLAENPKAFINTIKIWRQEGKPESINDFTRSCIDDTDIINYTQASTSRHQP